MDDSWQMKCSSTWQPLMPSSFQLQPQEPRSLVWNAGHFYPHAAEESSSVACGRRQEIMVPKASNLFSDNSGHADLGSPFLSLLSGRPPLLHCDSQQFSSPKPFVTSSKVPVNSESFAVGAAGSGISPFTQNLSTRNSKIGADLSPVVSSSGMASATYGSGFNLSDVLEATNLKHQSSEVPRPVICHSNASNVKLRDFPCLNGGWLSSSSPSDAGKSHGASAQTSQKAPLETNSPISWRSSTLTSGCPRVFCLGASGDLLLSNTGLLGVVCLCHGLHMSISKFAEHSGLCDVNPGDAVHVDSGETIAQWRSLYFHKFGIRVPEDHNGWDWPDGFLPTPGSVKRYMAVSDVPKTSDLSNLVGTSGRFVGFGQPQNSFACLKNPNSGSTFVNEGMYNAKQRNTQDDCNFLRKGLLGSLHSNLPPVADNQILGSSMSGFSMMSKFNGSGGPDNGCHSISAYIDSISRSGQSFISHQNLHNSKSCGNDSDVSRFFSLKGGVIDRDAMSSSFELRLGQPSTQTLGNSVVPAFRSHPFDTPCDQKSLFPEQSIHNSNYRAMEECSQYLQHAAGSSNSCARIGQNQSNLVNHEIVINNARNAAIIEQLKGDADRSSVISMLLSQFKTPDERMHLKATGGVIDGFHVTSRTLQGESHVAKCDPTYSPLNRGDSTENQLNINRLGLQKHVDKGKEVAHAADSLCIATEPKFDFHTKHVESSINCDGIGGTSHHSCFAVHDKSLHPYQFSGMMTAARDTRNPFNHSGKIPCFGLSGHLHHGFCRSTSLPMDSGPILPSQAISMGSSAATSNCVLNTLPALTNKEGSGVSPSLDENLRTLALRRIIALSNQGHSNVSPGANEDQGRLSNTCAEKMHNSIADPSWSDGQRHGFAVSSKQIASEVSIKPLQSGFNSWMGGDADSAAGLNKWCSYSAFSLGNPLHSKNIEMQCQLSSDPYPNEQPLGRYGQVENNITPNERGKCCQQVPYTYLPASCGCTIHTNCLGVNCNSKAETLSSASKEWTGSLNGMASVFIAPSAKGTSTSRKEKSVSLNQSGNLGQVRKKVECHAFQWRDVPSKAIGMHNLTCKDCPVDLLDRRENVCPVDLLDRRENVAEQTAAATKCFERSAQDAESSKEQEISNISSGCSAAAVTQASVEFNNLGSAAVGAGDKCTQNLVVDEGSGIDKCWSSDDLPDSERSSEFFGFASKIHSANKGSSKPLPNQSSRSLIDELRLRDSLILKNVRNPVHKGVSIIGKANHAQEGERGIKSAKSKRPTKWKKLDESFSDSGTGSVHWHSHSSKDLKIRVQPDQGRSYNCACSGAATLEKRSVLCSSMNISRKRDLHGLYYDRDGENGNIQLKVEDDRLEVPGSSFKKRFRLGQSAQTVKQLGIQEPYCADTGVNVKSNLADCMVTSSTEEVDIFRRKVRPVACGKYGILSNGVSLGPAKIVSLRKVLKSARRYTLAENDQLNLASAKKSKRGIRGRKGCIDKERGCVGPDDMVSSGLDPDNCVNGTEIGCSSGGKELDVPCMFENKKGNEGGKDHKIADSCLKSRLKPKFKETRKRSLYELSIKGKDSSGLAVSGIYTSRSLPQKKCRYLAKFLKNSEDGKCRAGAICSAKSSEEQQCQSLISHADAFCCVCGSSNKDEINCLLECGRCSIRVHQACYGVSKVPRGRWYCRPCRTSSKNIVCVLCGYGGGAMTRALRSRNIVKSLLKAWNIITESVPKDTIPPPEALEDRFGMLDSSTSGVGSNSFPVIRPVQMEPSSPVVWKMDLHRQLNRVNDSSCSPGNMKVHNSITAGFFDSTVKQWVHMVCGLWTPTTRCPNVDTMSAFDVSGASCPKANVVCSMCNRPGGSCMQCRVRDCSVQFHPWCAHQKGLLQSEVEGVDNENVGFYGRCILHAAYHQCDSDGEPIDTEACQPGEQEYTCARTEGYKGRKREGFRHDIPRQSNGYGGCVVPQDQLNAWLHINRQKSCPKGLPKLPISDVENDCRKEYARYKQSKGWKHLVVYKSGIHALGLYTSQFISRGAMVVEYVGEIVGLRVSDKRESEYQSGRKLQYKSACYFFRIDKEHIIDATRKGGIARFVNHSCLPNCVAKVISVRNEKKVVFFAERDIYPGEEITYDYHFNHEDEGKKIPCFCNSKNCRRYLN